MRAYRLLLRLYPPSFRAEFGPDLVQLFDDLVSRRGRAEAWRICALDLLVTLPRSHLERIMGPRHSTTAVTATIVVLAAAGAASFLTGLYPGSLLLVAAVVFGVANRSGLGRAIRTPDARLRRLRRRRLGRSAVLAAVFLACYGVFLATVGETWTGRETALALVGTTSLVGAAVSLVVGLLTPRTATARTL